MIEQKTAPYAATLLRVSMGALFLAHGLLLKVMTFGIAGTVGWFESVGYPGVMAYAVIAAEIGGGLALIAGVKVRLVALALIPLMLGATVQHLPAGWLFSNEGGGWEFPLFWTLALGVQALLGRGAFALEDAIAPSRATAPA